MKFYRYIVCAFLFIGAAIAETININWLNDGETYAQTTCEIGGDIILPTTPTKRGYTFKGWVAEYTRLEYIGSTGTQYIDTGYVMTSDVVEYGISVVGKNSSASRSLFGSETSTSPRYSGVIYGNKLFIGNSTALASFTWADDKNDIVVKTTSATFGTLTHNGLDIPFTYTGGIQKTVSIALFGNNQGAEISQLSSIKVSHFYIKDNGTLVRNLIPAKRNSDSVIGMYDTVSGTFFTNSGTGEFIAGPVAENQNFDE